MKRVYGLGRRVLGAALVVFGVGGLFLPFIQGIACIVLGAMLLGIEREHVLRLLAWVEHRAPRLKRPVAWVRKAFDRLPRRASTTHNS